ncbi:MAG: proton-conducting transporter membrane subunit [Candidatus Margulisiibacteriota bacterium]
MTIFSFTPGIIFLIGSICTFLFKKRFIKALPIIIPILSLLTLTSFTESSTLSIPFLGYTLGLLRVDSLSLTFGYLFTIFSFFAFIYGLKIANSREYTAALFYIGSALSVIFTNDFITLYIFWELMAVSSVFLILLSKTENSFKSSLRYIIVHLVGGLILLAGIVIHIHSTGSTEFTALTLNSISSGLIFIGFLINAASIPFSSWLSDAYPESTLMGGVILSSITTKTAIYTLIRGFSGTDILIWLGVITAIYGIVYGLIENNVRRSLSFSVINQVGFKLVGIGIGSPLAIAGVCAHVVCGVIYNSVLWTSAGNLIYLTGKHKYSDLSIFNRRLPLLLLLAIIGALSISSFPFTSGYISKSIILKSVELAHLFTPWLLLEFASFGVVLLVFCKFIYHAFFYKNSFGVVKNISNQLNPLMLFSSIIFSAACIYLGLFPKIVYEIIPFSKYLMAKIPSDFIAIYSKSEKLIITLQKFIFAVLAYVLFSKYIPSKNSIFIDFDWLYRKLLRFLSVFFISFVDFVYLSINSLVVGLISKMIYFFNNSLSLLIYVINLPSLRLSNIQINRYQLLKQYHSIIIKNGFPFVLIGSFIFILSIALYLISI